MNKKGFTLLELLVVVLIIGILASVALPKYQMAVMRSRYSTLKANVRALYEAEKIYYMANGVYSADLETLSIDLPGCTLNPAKNTCTYSWGSCVVNLVPGRVSCEDRETLQNGYAMYFVDSDTYGVNCWAFSTNQTDKYNRLCQKEGGVYTNTGTCTGDACRIYKISEAL